MGELTWCDLKGVMDRVIHHASIANSDGELSDGLWAKIESIQKEIEKEYKEIYKSF